MTDDQAVNQFLQKLREKPVEDAPRDRIVDISAHVTINRPVHCTFVIGGQHFSTPKAAARGGDA